MATAAVAAAALAAGRSVAVLKPAQTGCAAGRARGRRRGGPARGRGHGRRTRPLSRAVGARHGGPAGRSARRCGRTKWRRRRASWPPSTTWCWSRARAACSYGSTTEGGTLADAARLLDAPVLVVASAGLGTLNTTELTARELRARAARPARRRDRQLAGRPGSRLALQPRGPAGGRRGSAAGRAARGLRSAPGRRLPCRGGQLARAPAGRNVGRGGFQSPLKGRGELRDQPRTARGYTNALQRQLTPPTPTTSPARSATEYRGG